MTRYSAFISYRHLHPDQEAAAKLQAMLESYRPPKGLQKTGNIGKVFLDRAELPTSQDLGDSLREALINSDYLIVIVSEHLKESKWCMEEIRLFKELHGGRTDRILPVLISGEPDLVLPEELLFEDLIVQEADGGIHTVRKEVEPLCCDVRAKHTGDLRRQIQEIKRKMRTEMLRLAAPMLGCGFDDLFQRNRHRQRRRRIILGSVVVGILVLLLVVVTGSYLQVTRAYDQVKEAYEKVTISEQKYRSGLMDSYAASGVERAADGKSQEAMAYYTKVLSEMPDNRIAGLGALIEIQDLQWICEERAAENSSTQEKYKIIAKNTGKQNGFRIDMDKDGRKMTLRCQDGRSWEMTLPEQVISFNVNKEPPVWISPYSYAAAVPVEAMLLFFDMDTGEVLSAYMDSLFAAYGPKEVVFSPDKEKFAYTIQTAGDIGAGFITGIGALDGSFLSKSAVSPSFSYVNIVFSRDSRSLLWAQDKSLVMLDTDTAGESSVRLSLARSIVQADLTDDGTVLTKEADGTVHKYRIFEFSCEPETTAGAKEENTQNFFRVSKDEHHLELLDENGLVKESHTSAFEYIWTAEYDDMTGTIYCFSSSGVTPFKISGDRGSIVMQEPVRMENGSMIVSECVYPGGFAVSIGGKLIQIYRYGDTTPYRTIYEDGHEMALDGKGLLAVIPYSGGGIAVWDIETERRISRIQSYKNDLHDVLFTEKGDLTFTVGFGEERHSEYLCLSAPEPDDSTVLTLKKMCCYSLNDDLTLSVREPFCDGLSGNWEGLLR